MSKRIQVMATQEGHYGSYRLPGDRFYIANEEAFSKVWMVRADSKQAAQFAEDADPVSTDHLEARERSLKGEVMAETLAETHEELEETKAKLAEAEERAARNEAAATATTEPTEAPEGVTEQGELVAAQETRPQKGAPYLMGYSQLELANQALDQLQKRRISALAEESNSAQLIRGMMKRVIDSALSRSTWTFARRVEDLVRITENDRAVRWEFRYQLPSDCLTFVRIHRLDQPYETRIDYRQEFQILGNSVYTNREDAQGEYVYSTDDTTAMPSAFLDAVATLLARDLTSQLNQPNSKFWNAINNRYEMQLGVAINQDSGQESTAWGERRPGYTEARRARGFNRFRGDDGRFDGSTYWNHR